VWSEQAVVVGACGAEGYSCDAMDGGGSSVCRTWFDILTTLLNSSSSAASHSSSNVGRDGGEYPWRRAQYSPSSFKLSWWSPKDARV